MLRFITSRLLLALFAFWLVNSGVFFLARSTGDAAALLVPLDATPDQALQIRQSLGLDRPLLAQYGRFLGDLAHGDLGVSYRNREPVATLLVQRAGASFRLSSFALLVALLVGVPAGMIAAVRQGRWPDHLVQSVAFVTQFSIGSVLLFILFVTHALVGAATDMNLHVVDRRCSSEDAVVVRRKSFRLGNRLTAAERAPVEERE